MPRQKKVVVSGDDFELMIESLNNDDKPVKREINGFKKSSNGLWINDKRYVTNSIIEIIIIGKLDEDNCFEYLSRRDCEYCKSNGLRYEKNI
jgi:hypothetical protein